MRHLLSRDLTISQEEVDALASDPTTSHSCCNALSHEEHVARRFPVKLGQGRSMTSRDDQRVPSVHRLDIQEGPAQIISGNNT